MRPPHVLRVEAGPGAFASLVAAARAVGLRVGWLELGSDGPQPPAELESAAAVGVLRAVAVGGGRSVAVKPIRGPSVMRDLLREHFAGCLVVLGRGVVEAPLLTPDGGRWRVESSAAGSAGYSTDELLSQLRKPRPFGRPG